MNLEGKTLVLEVGYEGGSFELFADIEDGVPVRFFYKTGGPTMFDEDDMPPDPVKLHGPFTWPEVLAGQLERNGWLWQCPLFVHPCLIDIIRQCVEREPQTGWRWIALIAGE